MLLPSRTGMSSWIILLPVLVVVVVLLPFVVGWQTTTQTGATLRRSHHYHHRGSSSSSSSSLLSLATLFATAEDPSVTASDDDEIHNHKTAAGMPTTTTTSRRLLVHQLVRIATTGRLLAYRVPSARAAAEPEESNAAVEDPFVRLDALLSDTVDEILTNNNKNNIHQDGTLTTPVRDGRNGNSDNNNKNNATTLTNSDMDSALRDAQNRRTVLPRTHG